MSNFDLTLQDIPSVLAAPFTLFPISALSKRHCLESVHAVPITVKGMFFI